LKVERVGNGGAGDPTNAKQHLAELVETYLVPDYMWDVGKSVSGRSTEVIPWR
jgi:hypothetical protein